jgi:hypothetical protein
MLTLFLLLLVPSAHAACPDLSGSFGPCVALLTDKEADIRRMTIQQRGASYHLETFLTNGSESESELVPDGVVRKSEETSPDGPTSVSAISSKCEDDALDVNNDVTIPKLGLGLNIRQQFRRGPRGALAVELSFSGSSPVLIVCEKVR